MDVKYKSKLARIQNLHFLMDVSHEDCSFNSFVTVSSGTEMKRKKKAKE